MVVPILATTAFVPTSIRSTRWSAQLGDQTLPKPTAMPEQGARLTWTVAASVAEAGSIRATLFLALFEIQTVSGPMPTQSGLPGMDSFAAMGSVSIGCCTAFRLVICLL